MEAKMDLFGVCPYVTAQRLLSGKWSLLIMHLLSEGPVRFNQLQRRMPTLTQASLSKQLKALEQDGLIIRREYPQIPPKVEYSLSPIGEQFRPVLAELKKWGDSYIACLKEREINGKGC
jgi:DNA-binding HxlR family transcriptional regulator